MHSHRKPPLVLRHRAEAWQGGSAASSHSSTSVQTGTGQAAAPRHPAASPVGQPVPAPSQPGGRGLSPPWSRGTCRPPLLRPILPGHFRPRWPPASPAASLAAPWARGPAGPDADAEASCGPAQSRSGTGCARLGPAAGPHTDVATAPGDPSLPSLRGTPPRAGREVSARPGRRVSLTLGAAGPGPAPARAPPPPAERTRAPAAPRLLRKPDPTPLCQPFLPAGSGGQQAIGGTTSRAYAHV